MVETIGIVGGGQLGRMLTEAAKPLGFDVVVTNKDPMSPAAQVGAREIVAPLDSEQAIDQLAEQADVLTWEIEHIPAHYLCVTEEEGDVEIQPSPRTLATIQDKLRQKQMLVANDIPVAPFIDGIDNIAYGLGNVGPYIVKTRTRGYDGRGNLVTAETDPEVIKTTLDAADMIGPYLTEQTVDFDKELSVVVARDMDGKTTMYAVTETYHEENICHTTITPARIEQRQHVAATDLAHDTLGVLQGAGVFAIEMFLRGDDVMVNEIAPRVHNSGHWTIEGAMTSQFEQHIRAITGMPLGSTRMRAPAAVMINILGHRDEPFDREGLDEVLAYPDTHVHLYGKSSRPARKIGHITVLGDTPDEALEMAHAARDKMPV